MAHRQAHTLDVPTSDVATSHGDVAMTPEGEIVTLSLLGERVYEPQQSRKARSKRLHEVLKVVRKYDLLHGLSPDEFKEMLEELGPTFVKAGQILSMRSEIIPQAFCKVLETLRMDAEPMTFDTVKKTLQSQYTKPLDQIFATIDKKPLGSASVAQVHRATLKTGEQVAVKVQRPHVRETMAQDIEVMRTLHRRLKPFMRFGVMDFQGVIDELWESFTEETNFLVEAKNLEEFRKNNADVAYVAVPKPYRRYSTSQVLVMEYVEGFTISQTKEIVAEGYDLHDIGTKLVVNYIKQILSDGFFHADPHPGNIMIRDRKIVWIDLGMVGRLSGFYRKTIHAILLAVGERDSAKLKTALLALSENDDSIDIDHGALLAELDEIVSTYASIDLASLDVGKFMTDLVSMARNARIKLPGAMTMIARGLVTLEGVLDEFIPGVSMITIIEDNLLRQESANVAAQKEVQELALEGQKAIRGTLNALADLGLVTQMLTRGQLKVNMDFSGSKDPVEDLSHMADRLTMGVIIAGLLLGSAILYQAGTQGHLLAMAILALIGYGVALLLALYVAWDIFKRHRAHERGED